MNLKQLKKEMRKDPKFRKAEWNGQWDTVFMSANIITELKLLSGLNQTKLAKKAKVKQESLSRAESHGCTLGYLNKLAKVTGYKLEIKIKKSLLPK